MPKTQFIIGLDFDNTIVSYDEAMVQTALELDLIDAKAAVENKQQIRDYLRGLPAGEIKWQKLQAEVYGKQMNRARLIEGVERFLRACKDQHIATFIVSHKSKHAAQDTDKIDLQQAALKWMKDQGFFEASKLGLSRDQVFFENTREEKISRIKQLNCSHFIDDLEEIFLEKSFPQGTFKILYSSKNVAARKNMKVMHDWKEIYEHFFS